MIKFNFRKKEKPNLCDVRVVNKFLFSPILTEDGKIYWFIFAKIKQIYSSSGIWKDIGIILENGK